MQPRPVMKMGSHIINTTVAIYFPFWADEIIPLMKATGYLNFVSRLNPRPHVCIVNTNVES